MTLTSSDYYALGKPGYWTLGEPDFLETGRTRFLNPGRTRFLKPDRGQIFKHLHPALCLVANICQILVTGKEIIFVEHWPSYHIPIAIYCPAYLSISATQPLSLVDVFQKYAFFNPPKHKHPTSSALSQKIIRRPQTGTEYWLWLLDARYRKVYI